MSDPTLYLYTSLTAGSSHIVTATARLETILKANKLPFRAIDVATDEVARKLWGRRSKGKKLPGLVKFGTVVGDLEQVEEWNEYGELRMQINSVEDYDSIPASSTTTAQPETPSATSTPTPETATLKQSTIKIQSPPSKETPKDSSIAVAMRQASEEAAARAKGNSSQPPAAKEPIPAVTEKKETPAADEQSQTGKEDTVRGKTASPGTQDSKPKRPPLVPEVAAESSANFHADAAEALGLVQHHRGSIISATSKEEQEKVAQDLRKSISGGQQDLLQSLREDHAARTEQEETIEEESDGGEEQDGTPSRKDAQDVHVSG